MLALVLDVATGPSSLSFSTVVHGLFVPGALADGPRIILWDVRLPDALMAVVVGAALGLAGIEMQTVLNNPLASPFTLGLSSAAALGASAAIALQLSIPGPFPLTAPVFAFLGALSAGLAVLAFARAYSNSVGAIILFGIALLFLGDALIAVLQFVSSDEAVRQIVFWRLGDLTKAGWLEVAVVTIVCLLILPLSLRASSALTALRGGEDIAKGSGLAVAKIRRNSVIRISILTAAAVSFVGSISFIGLVSPHIARLMLGEDHRFLLPGAAIVGAVLLSLASTLTKSIVPGLVIPVGIATALIGVPVFVVLILSQRKIRV